MRPAVSRVGKFMVSRPLAQLRDRRPSGGDHAVALPRIRGSLSWGFLVALLLGCMLANLALGAFDVGVERIAAILLGKLGIDIGVEYTAAEEAVVWVIRVPRMVLAALVGAGLGVSGAALQGIFRNPLAEPSLIGVSSGAAFAVALAVLLGLTSTTLFVQPLVAFVGGLIFTLGIYLFSRSAGRVQIATMLLVGIAVNALLASAISFILSLSDDGALRDIVYWILGSLGGSVWEYAISAGPLILIAIAVLVRQARALNLLSLGDAEARHLGLRVERSQFTIVTAAALATGAGVAVAGVVGFVGLVAPHLVRLVVGPDHRRLIPGSALSGAILVLGADLGARTIVSPAELPLGVVTAVIGAPVFLYLIHRARRSLARAGS